MIHSCYLFSFFFAQSRPLWVVVTFCHLSEFLDIDNDPLCRKLADCSLITKENVRKHLVSDEPYQIVLDDLQCQSQSVSSSFIKPLQKLKLSKYFGNSTLGMSTFFSIDNFNAKCSRFINLLCNQTLCGCLWAYQRRFFRLFIFTPLFFCFYLRA